MDQPVFIGVELGQLDGAKVDVPQAVGGLPQADQFTSQGLAEVDLVTPPLDITLGTDLSNHGVVGISHLG